MGQLVCCRSHVEPIHHGKNHGIVFLSFSLSNLRIDDFDYNEIRQLRVNWRACSIVGEVSLSRIPISNRWKSLQF